MNKGNWKIGKTGGSIVTDIVKDTISERYHPKDIGSELLHYGGVIIAESIHPANEKVLVKSKEMFEIIDSLENDNNTIPVSIWNKIQEIKNYIKS